MKSKCYHKCCSIVWCKCDSIDFDCCAASLVNPSASTRAPNRFSKWCNAHHIASEPNVCCILFSFQLCARHIVCAPNVFVCVCVLVALRCRIFHKLVRAASRVNLACVALFFQLRDFWWRVVESSGCCSEAHLLQNLVPHVPPYSDLLWVYRASMHSAIKLQYSS